MEPVSNDRRDFVRAIYEQHLAHVRQLEQQRLWLAGWFALLYVGALMVMAGDVRSDYVRLVIGLTMILALVGLLLSAGFQRVVRIHQEAVRLILERYSLDHYRGKDALSQSAVMLDASRLVPVFFLLCFCSSLFLLLRFYFIRPWVIVAIPLALFLLGAAVSLFWPVARSSQREQE